MLISNISKVIGIKGMVENQVELLSISYDELLITRITKLEMLIPLTKKSSLKNRYVKSLKRNKLLLNIIKK